MNNAFLMVAGFVFSLQVYAGDLSIMSVQSRQANAPNPEASQMDTKGTTYFDALVGWYSQGTPVKFAQFKGFYTGRCFAVNKPNAPMNVMMGYGTLAPNDDAGPAFPASSSIKISAISHDGQSADYFDSGDHAVQFQSVLNQYWKNISDLSENPTLSWSYDWEPNGKFDEKHEIVSYNGYLIDKWTALIKQEYGDMGLKSPGDILNMCYYFKQISK